MGKPIIFVSHAAVDSSVAKLFKEDVERNFLGLCELFVSSDLGSIQGGDEWIKNIQKNLNDAVMSIGLYSPVALSRPWIYAEFGAGWIRGIPTISLCHSGLRKDDLPVPLSHFQALDLVDEFHLKHLYEQIAQAVGCQLPSINYTQESQKYRSITEEKRVKRNIDNWFKNLTSWNPELSKELNNSNKSGDVLIPSQFESDFFNFKKESEDLGFLHFTANGMAMGTRVGAQASVWSVSKGESFDCLIAEQ